MFQAYLWREYRKADIVPYNTWPVWARKLFFKEHKNRVDRFTLFVFLVGNGTEPKIARRLILVGQYDASAHNQMEELVTRGPPRNVMYWDVHNHKNMKFHMYN